MVGPYKKILTLLIVLLFISLNSLIFSQNEQKLMYPGEEKFFESIEKLTDDGDNAEAYFSFDGKKLIFQRTDYKQFMCDQIFIYDLQKHEYKLVSTGKGRTTCSYFMPDGEHVIYSSTHHLSEKCPEVPKLNLRRYYWTLFPYDIFLLNLKTKKLQRLTTNPYYDAEGTVNSKGEIVFTSLRDGDIGIYILNVKTKKVTKVINKFGYEGGPYFMPDNEHIVFRAFYPKNEEEKKEYQELLAKNVVSPKRMEIYIVKRDGTELKQITNFGKVSFSPYPHPSGKYIIFSANLDPKIPYNFDLYLIKTDGTGLTKITSYPGFESFPMFSPDGKYLVFASNRAGKTKHETNIFLAKLKDFIKP